MNTPPRHHNNFNLIRLLAAMQVMIVHALNHFGISGYAVEVLKIFPGVPTFFFLSGYLICSSYQRTTGKGLLAFFKNRVLRIYPALWVCILLSTATVFILGYLPTPGLNLSSFFMWLVGQMTILQFYNPEFMRGFGVGVLNGALWTVSIELQFYLLMPVIYYLAQRAKAFLILVFLLSLALNVYFRQHLDWNVMYMKLLYVSFAPWLYIFLLGCFIALNEEWIARIKRLEYKYLLPAYLLAMNFIGTYERNAENSINPVAVLLLIALLLKFGTAQLALPAKITAVIRNTDFSYGLYLYHMPIINVLLFTGAFSAGVNVFATVVFSIVAAMFSWYVVERPALKHKY